MKKFYFSPEASLIELANDDILTTSGGLSIENNVYGNDDKSSLTDLFGL